MRTKRTGIEYKSSSNTSIGSRQTKSSTDSISGAFRLLSDKQAAHYLGISRSLLRDYVSRGVLHRVLLPHPTGVGYVNRMLLDVRDLDSFIEVLKSKTTN